MNIHPVIVHFPIALLSLYALLELVQLFPKLRQKDSLTHIKLGFLLLGTFFALLTLPTGETAEHTLGRDNALRALVNTHSFFATLSTDLFVGISILYVLRWVVAQPWYVRIPELIRKLIAFVQKIFDHQVVIIVVTVVGLLGILITGALGGAIVYGPTVDPVVRFVYKLFF